MTNNKPSLEAAAQSLIDDAPAYVDSVAKLAESHQLTATADIVSSSGLKLLSRGARIDKSLREKLSGHRLAGTTLEKCLAIAGSATPGSLALDSSRLIDQDEWLNLLANKSGDPGAIRHGLSRLALPDAVLFRLTVAREQRPMLYRHSLRVATISHYLALRISLKPALVDSVLIAALCHDLGELYTDPAILEPGHQVSDEERRFIYVHPITGWLIVREIASVDQEVKTAIIQHQERLDGSGYPFGIRAAAFGMPGRILAVADVSDSIMKRFSDQRRLSTLLRLNSIKYDRQLIDLMHEAFLPTRPDSEKSAVAPLKARLTGLAQLLDGWASLRADPVSSQSAPVIFLTERMYNLRTEILAFGFDPDSLERPLQLAEEDPIIANELATVLDELQFQLVDLEHEIDRRASDWSAELNPLAAVAIDGWKQHLRSSIRD